MVYRQKGTTETVTDKNKAFCKLLKAYRLATKERVAQMMYVCLSFTSGSHFCSPGSKKPQCHLEHRSGLDARLNGGGGGPQITVSTNLNAYNTDLDTRSQRREHHLPRLPNPGEASDQSWDGVAAGFQRPWRASPSCFPKQTHARGHRRSLAKPWSKAPGRGGMAGVFCGVVSNHWEGYFFFPFLKLPTNVVSRLKQRLSKAQL